MSKFLIQFKANHQQGSQSGKKRKRSAVLTRKLQRTNSEVSTPFAKYTVNDLTIYHQFSYTTVTLTGEIMNFN